MAEASFKGKLSSHAGEFLAALLLIQPVLDVLSYFRGGGIFTSGLRLFLLVFVTLYGFLLSDRKHLYAALFCVIGGFWFLHVLNCIRVGYPDPVMDTSAYLKIVQFPLWTAAFLTLFRKREGLDLQITVVLAVDFVIILLVIGLSYLTGLPVYTYDFPEREIKLGVLGWFLHGNAQSAILTMLIPGMLLWAYRTGKLWIFCLCSLGGFGLLYATGTRIAFLGGILIAAVFLLGILLGRKKRLFCLPLLASIVLLLAFRGVSPMAQRQQVSVNSFAVYQEKIDQIMGEDKDFVYTEGEEIPQPVYEKIRRVYSEIYGNTGVYGEPLMTVMIQRYGPEKVMERLEYSTDAKVLNNARNRKIIYMQMLWEEEDFLTHLLGMDLVHGNTNDPENDFPSLLFYYGYLGFGLYTAVLLGIFLYAAFAFFRKFPLLLSVEFAAPACMFAMAVGAALFSGWVFRWPNVTVYFSLAAAMLISQAESARPAGQLQPGHKRNPAVEVKKI